MASLLNVNFVESAWHTLQHTTADTPQLAAPPRAAVTAAVLVASVVTILLAALLPVTLFIDPTGRSLIVYPPWVDERAALEDVTDAGSLLIGVRSDLPLGIVGVAAAVPQDGFAGSGFRLPWILPFGCAVLAGGGS
jgi:hypothetical protein